MTGDLHQPERCPLIPVSIRVTHQTRQVQPISRGAAAFRAAGALHSGRGDGEKGLGSLVLLDRLFGSGGGGGNDPVRPNGP